MTVVVNLFALGGVVMWPLLGFSVLVTALFLERGLFWWQLLRHQGAIIQGFLQAYPQEQEEGGLEGDAIARLTQHTDLPLPRIFLAALQLPDATPEEFRLGLERAAQAELPGLNRFSTLFGTVIGVAPLLGLLGTILGLIDALASVQLGDGSGAAARNVTLGIGEALVSTAVGMVVAIYTLLFANGFQGLYRRQRAIIQDYGGRLELLYRQRYRRQFPVDQPLADSVTDQIPLSSTRPPARDRPSTQPPFSR